MAEQVGRLAMRLEGDFWCGYYAMPGTMNGALLLGSIRATMVADNPGRKRLFTLFMTDACSDIIEQATGSRPTWNDPTTAPEHERSGNA